MKPWLIMLLVLSILLAIGMRDHLHKIQAMPPALPTWQTRFKKLLARA